MSTPTAPDGPPPSAVRTTPGDAADRSTRSIRVLSILVIVAGAIFIVAGVVTWFVVRDQLADEKIVVSDDAERFGGVGGRRTLHRLRRGQRHRKARPRGEWRQDLRRARPRGPDAPDRHDGLVPSVLAVHLGRRLRRCLHGGRPWARAHRNRRGAAARCPPPQYRSSRGRSDVRRNQPLTPPNDVPSRQPRRYGRWSRCGRLAGHA